MSDDFIEQIEPTPKIHSKRCKSISFLIKAFLSYGAFLSAAFIWIKYDLFMSILTFILSFIIIGIIRSKLRNSVIPYSQREYYYSDMDIADWYSAKRLCYENL